jgi:N-acetylglutamate synthase-like GNAT family acetyltransferase
MTDCEITMFAIPADSGELRHALMAARLPIDDLEEQGRQFFRFSLDGATIGFGGLETHGKHVLLRSIVVLSQYRARGLGRTLTQALLARAGGNGATTAYLLTDTAEAFFRQAGFERMERTDAPAAILATRQAATICPASAALMIRNLIP